MPWFERGFALYGWDVIGWLAYSAKAYGWEVTWILALSAGIVLVELVVALSAFVFDAIWDIIFARWKTHLR